MNSVQVRELAPSEFPRVEEELWKHYHGQRAEKGSDRIFGAFVDGTLAGCARVRRHKDGLEVDGVFVLDEFRGQGLARRLMDAVLEGFGDRTLWMHSVIELIPFYRSLGWQTVPEEDLPPTIKERLIFCLGEMEGCGVAPMVRAAGGAR